jgi:hypothetical protein
MWLGNISVGSINSFMAANRSSSVNVNDEKSIELCQVIVVHFACAQNYLIPLSHEVAHEKTHKDNLVTVGES